MELTQYYMTLNPCYTKAAAMVPAGIVVHDTAAGNPKISRYVGPDDGVIGPNKYGNDWNKPTAKKCVHAFIGQDKDGMIRTYNVLPWVYKCWGCGGGSKGSYNNTHIQFEICDDGYKKGKGSEEYFRRVYQEAVELCAYLCKLFSLDVSAIVCHKEAHNLGYASDHSDVLVWFGKYGTNMDDFRADVDDLIRNVPRIVRPTYLLYGPGSKARKLMYLEAGSDFKPTGKEKGDYIRVECTRTYIGYIPKADLEVQE